MPNQFRAEFIEFLFDCISRKSEMQYASMCPYFFYKCHTRGIYAERHVAIKCIISCSSYSVSAVRNVSMRALTLCMEANDSCFPFPFKKCTVR